MSDIFISYAREDKETAKQFANALEEQGYSVWWDRVIPVGRVFDDVIEEALDDSKCVVVLWSKESVASKWVKTEAGEGEARGILIPVLIDKVKTPLAFRRIQTADMVDWDGDITSPKLEKLLENVKRLVKPAFDIEAQRRQQEEEKQKQQRKDEAKVKAEEAQVHSTQESKKEAIPTAEQILHQSRTLESSPETSNDGGHAAWNRRVVIVPIVMAIVWSVAWLSRGIFLYIAEGTSQLMLGAIGGVGTGLVLRWLVPSISFKQVALITMVWLYGFIAGELIAVYIANTLDLRQGVSVVGTPLMLLVSMHSAIGAGIGGLGTGVILSSIVPQFSMKSSIFFAMGYALVWACITFLCLVLGRQFIGESAWMGRSTLGYPLGSVFSGVFSGAVSGLLILKMVERFNKDSELNQKVETKAAELNPVSSSQSTSQSFGASNDVPDISVGMIKRFILTVALAIIGGVAFVWLIAQITLALDIPLWSSYDHDIGFNLDIGVHSIVNNLLLVLAASMLSWYVLWRKYISLENMFLATGIVSTISIVFIVLFADIGWGGVGGTRSVIFYNVMASGITGLLLAIACEVLGRKTSL